MSKITIFQGQRVRVKTPDGRPVHGKAVPCGAEGTVEGILAYSPSRGDYTKVTEWEFNWGESEMSTTIIVVMDDKLETPVRDRFVSSNNAILTRPCNLEFLTEYPAEPETTQLSCSMRELKDQELDMIAVQIYARQIVGRDSSDFQTIAKWSIEAAKAYIAERDALVFGGQ